MPSDNEIKLAFIDVVLNRHGRKMKDAMQKGIRENQYNGTGRMENTVEYFVDRSNNSDGTLHFKTVGYLRMQDIYASHKNRKEKADGRKRGKNIKDNQFTGRKGFYTKSIYQHITPILWALSYGFTKEIIENFRKHWEGYKIYSTRKKL